jgi:DNA repair exonuclease SbcCD ATPase subunit
MSRLYGIDVDGKKARWALPRLFQVYTVLYAETVVQCLGATGKKQLSDALLEVTMGADVVKAWKKLQVAATAATAFRKEAERSQGTARARVEEAKTILSGMDAERRKELEDQLKSFGKSLPAAFAPNLKTKDGPSQPKVLRSLARLKPDILAASKLVEETRELLKQAKTQADWKSIKTAAQLADRKSAQLNEKLSKLQENVTSGTDHLQRLQEEEVELGELIPEIASALDGIAVLQSETTFIRKWLPALDADERETAIENEIAAAQEAEGPWKRISGLLERVPTTAQAKVLDTYALETATVRRRLEKDLTDTDSKIQSVKMTIQALDADIKERKVAGSRTKALAQELHGTLAELAALHQSSKCAACGHDWNENKNVQKAYGRRLAELQREIGTDDQKFAKLLQQKDQLTRDMRGHTEKLQDLQVRLADAVSAQQVGENKVADIQNLVREIATELNQIGLAVHVSGSEGLAPMVKGFGVARLRAKGRSAASKLARLENSRGAIWVGLDRAGYEKKEPEIASALERLSGVAEGLQIAVPTKWKIDSWDRLLKTADSVKESNQRTKAKHVKRHSVVRAEIRAQKKDLADAERTVAKLKSEKEKNDEAVSQWESIIEKLSQLVDWGLTPKRGTISLAEAARRLDDLRNDLEHLLIEVPAYVEQMQKQSVFEKQLKDSSKALALEKERVAVAKDVEHRLGKLTSPESFQTSALLHHSETVSDVFKRLHWPFDFSSVRFATSQAGLDIEVALRRQPERFEAAHKRLSAGQRAALAVSLFWALNTSQSHAPRFMLMDEPIQNVDELNTLNFLDSLRWLVEQEGRQVFLSTSSRRLAGLVTKKFSYLDDDYREFHLSRYGDVSDISVPSRPTKSVGRAARKTSR